MSIDAPGALDSPAMIDDVSSAADAGAPDAPEGAPLAPAVDAGPALGNPVFAPALATGLAMAAAGLMLGGVFKDILPRVVGVGAAFLGVAFVAGAVRLRKPWLQYLTLPVSLFFGALLTASQATGVGSASLPSLITEALRSGGALQPPIPFDPGWRVILVVLVSMLSAGFAALSIGLRRPRLGIMLALPLAMAGELVQPKATEVPSTIAAGVLVMAAVAVAYGANLSSQGVSITAGYERRRLTRTLGMLVALVVAAALVSQAGFLFPQPDRSRTVPAQRPQAAPPEPDRALFHYTSPKSVPLRLGTIDTYDLQQLAWLLPPVDTSRYVQLQGGRIPGSRTATGSYTVTVHVDDEPGHVLPDVAGMQVINESAGDAVSLDPRTDVVQLSDARLSAGLTYTMTVAPPPTGAQMAASAPPPREVQQFLVAPPPPAQVAALLQHAPADPFNRLQTLRQVLYTKVVAAGAGQPVDVAPARVVQMLNGAEATPYEITAGEALLARWAGVPSRIGFGYYGGDKRSDGSYEIHPRHGSTWLEAYFTGYGWVPVVGQPQNAKSSSDNNDKNAAQNIRPSDKLALTLIFPVHSRSLLQYFELIRYWIAVILPWLLLALAVYFLLPGFAKLLRSRQRRRYAQHHGTATRILVAYAGLRDVAYDLGTGDPFATPLEFLESIDDDEEHEELAWLATRWLWGDIRRGTTERDADRAEVLATSVTRRLRRAQGGGSRFLAFISRASLRAPYTTEIPNPWRLREPGTTRSSLRLRRRVSQMLKGARRWRRHAAVVTTLISTLLVSSCGSAGGIDDFRGPTTLSRTTALPNALGDPANPVTFTRAAPAVEAGFYKNVAGTLVAHGEVYLVHYGTIIEGSVQIELMLPTQRADDPAVLQALDDGIGGRLFAPVRLVPDQSVQVKQLVDQNIYEWYPPRSNAIEIVVLRKQFSADRQLVTALIELQHGRKPAGFTVAPEVAPNPNASAGSIDEQLPGGTASSPASSPGGAAGQPSPTPVTSPPASPGVSGQPSPSPSGGGQ